MLWSTLDPGKVSLAFSSSSSHSLSKANEEEKKKSLVNPLLAAVDRQFRGALSQMTECPQVFGAASFEMTTHWDYEYTFQTLQIKQNV